MKVEYQIKKNGKYIESFNNPAKAYEKMKEIEKESKTVVITMVKVTWK